MTPTLSQGQAEPTDALPPLPEPYRFWPRVPRDGHVFTADQMRDYARAALAASSAAPTADLRAAIPEGFQIVPIEPTDAMCDADWDVTMSEAHSNGGVASAAWRAMLEAAPQVTLGNGHSGFGWYMHDTDYPEEGAVFLDSARHAAAQLAAVAAPPGMVLVPMEPTTAMVAAYLNANTAYWERTDKLPTKLGKWRAGTPFAATIEGYKAMLAAVAAPDARVAGGEQSHLGNPAASQENPA